MRSSSTGEDLRLEGHDFHVRHGVAGAIGVAGLLTVGLAAMRTLRRQEPEERVLSLRLSVLMLLPVTCGLFFALVLLPTM